MDAAAVSTLSAFAVFASTVDHGRATALDALLIALFSFRRTRRVCDVRFLASVFVHAGAVRSVHGYEVVGRGGRGGWEKWVEREFVLSPSSCREVPVPIAAPRILPAEWRGRPVYREGLVVVGTWRCILAFDSVAAVAPPPTPPPVLSPFVYDHTSLNRC